jgi:hypothetical protein
MQIPDPRSLEAYESKIQSEYESEIKPPVEGQLKITPPAKVKLDYSQPMLALEWEGTKQVKVVYRASPKVNDPQDVIVDITSATICGSDLHLVRKKINS